ncbi:MAG: methyltransferase domain-containing protein [Blastocatellia bacterium]|nr:methyltransferase domain-containing protein [Blastocatellia bacterium]
MNENIQFLQAFLKNPGTVGSITPSSPELANKMIAGLRPGPDNIVIELGVGTGAITKYLQHIVPDERSYLGIEIDRHLVRSLRKKYSDLTFVRGNATDLADIHNRSGMGNVGAIICCLPFVSLPNKLGEKILQEIDKYMQQGCTFRTFQYAHGFYFPSAVRLREFMRRRYGKAQRSPMIVKNVPPAYTLTWSAN